MCDMMHNKNQPSSLRHSLVNSSKRKFKAACLQMIQNISSKSNLRKMYKDFRKKIKEFYTKITI
jgi:hypothetical protein